jgi:hypothetical protein
MAAMTAAPDASMPVSAVRAMRVVPSAVGVVGVGVGSGAGVLGTSQSRTASMRRACPVVPHVAPS